MKMSNQEGSSGITDYIQEEGLNIIPPAPSVDIEVTINGDTFQSLLADYKEKRENLFYRHPPSIFMVPSKLRNLKPICFTPQVVAIGPLHIGHKNVQEFEELKTTYLHHLLIYLEDSDVPAEQTLELCLQKVNGSIDRIRACYASSVTKSYSDAELAKMMVTDACFLLQFLCFRDSILNNPFLVTSIYQDFLLLENQIPFFVLQDVFDCTLKHCVHSLTSLILSNLKFLNLFQADENTIDVANPYHILGLIHTSCYPKSIVSSTTSNTLRMYKQSAVDLDKAGVKFKPNEDEDWPLSMKFKLSRFACFFHCFGSPTLKMPVLEIYDETEQCLRNLIAYEQCFLSVPNYFTSYVAVMDTLVDTADDILKLEKSKVIVNHLGSSEDAANMINSLYTLVILREFYYAEQWVQLDRYCNSYWPKHIARLKLTYFNSPWNIIALIAGFILFSLTMVQTIFGIKAA